MELLGIVFAGFMPLLLRSVTIAILISVLSRLNKSPRWQ
jgi:hypothetical protein